MEIEIGDSFVVKEDIWLEDIDDERKWVNVRPDDIRAGAIEKGTILLFSHLFHDEYFNFASISPGCIDLDEHGGEFDINEIDRFMIRIR